MCRFELNCTNLNCKFLHPKKNKSPNRVLNTEDPPTITGDNSQTNTRVPTEHSKTTPVIEASTQSSTQSSTKSPAQDFQQNTQVPDTSQILIGLQAAIQGLQLNMMVLIPGRENLFY